MASKETKQAQIAIRAKGQDRCLEHRSRIILGCKDCGGRLVCADCTTSLHRGHKFDDLSNIASYKKKQIQCQIDKLEKDKLSRIEKLIQSIDKQNKINSEQFEVLVEKIKIQGDKLKAKIDKITKELIQTCRFVEDDNSKRLSLYKHNLQSVHTEISKRVDQCRQTILRGSNIAVIDFERDNYTEPELPSSPTLETVEFTEGQKYYKKLKNGVGSLDFHQIQGLNLKRDETFFKGGKRTSQEEVKFRTTDSRVVSEFRHSASITSVEKSTSDSVWISYQYDRHVSRVNFHGDVKQKVELEGDVNDISVSPVTGNLWMCSYQDLNTVYEVLDGVPIKRFTTEDFFPLCMCVTRDDNVVLGTRNNRSLKVCSSAGWVLHSAEVLLKHAAVSVNHITTSVKTGDIAVCDKDSTFCGGKDKPHVIVFNSKLDLKYKYYGPPEYRNTHVMRSKFSPLDVVYDSQGRLIIADYNNSYIHLVSAEGEFLAVIYTDVLNPGGLALIDDGVLCVSFDDRLLKVIQYSA